MAVTVFVTSEQVDVEVGASPPAAPSLLTLRAAMPLPSYQHLAVRNDGQFRDEKPLHLHGEGAKHSEVLQLHLELVANLVG